MARSPSPTPTLIPEWEFYRVTIDGSRVVVELRVFAGIDFRVTLGGRKADEISYSDGILKHVFESMPPGTHLVLAEDVMGFSETREIILE